MFLGSTANGIELPFAKNIVEFQKKLSKWYYAVKLEMSIPRNWYVDLIINPNVKKWANLQ